MDSISALRAKQERDNAAAARGERLGRVVGHIQPKAEGEVKKKKKIGGLGFWAIASLAILKDLTDILLTGTVVLAIISTILSAFVICVVTFYFYYNGVSLMSTKKLATFLAAAVIDFIPYLAALPSFTTMVFLVRSLENNEIVKSVVSYKKGKFHERSGFNEMHV